MRSIKSRRGLIPAYGITTLAFFIVLSILICQPISAYAQKTGKTTYPSRLKNVINLRVGKHLIRAEIADTPELRDIGLMNRKSLGNNEGMLFVFEFKYPYCFWMKNTPLPLSIAFLDDDGSIINKEDMHPYNLNSHCPKKPVHYALEMNQGWFDQHNLKVGMRIIGLPPLTIPK